MSELLSRCDLTDEEVRKDALHELARAEAAGEAALAQWARTWGRAALAALAALDDRLAGEELAEFLEGVA